MGTRHSKSGTMPAACNRLLRRIGSIEEQSALETPALHPTIAEIEQAALWTTGEDDVLTKSGPLLSAHAVRILEHLDL
jgi:hypothetical protein